MGWFGLVWVGLVWFGLVCPMRGKGRRESSQSATLKPKLGSGLTREAAGRRKAAGAFSISQGTSFLGNRKLRSAAVRGRCELVLIRIRNRDQCLGCVARSLSLSLSVSFGQHQAMQSEGKRPSQTEPRWWG